MKIAYLGAGVWGLCLANLLAGKGHEVFLWTAKAPLATVLKRKQTHFKLQDPRAKKNLFLTKDLNEALEGANFIVESVTSKGLRPVLEQVKKTGLARPPLILTSKGIEQNSCLLMSEVAMEVFGEKEHQIGMLSGPSLANEVMQKLPTSVVAASHSPQLALEIVDLFSTPFFRVYPNEDVAGVCFGGAMKNIIAIACAIGDGLGFGENTKAALMTRGLHEIRKLSIVKGCHPETLSGLSGMGDLCATCLSTFSRNYIFGQLLAKGLTPEQARAKIGMVVEGSYTCFSAVQMSRQANIEVPITQAVYSIIYEKLNPKEAVESLLTRTVKQEHL